MFKLDEPLRDYHRASIRMTHKQKPSQSIIIPFTARTNARYTLFSPSSPADAQLRPGSAAISPGGIGANAGLSPRRPTDGRTAGAPPPRERPSARPSLPAAGTEPHRGRRHRRCPRAREEPGRTGHGARKGRKERRGAAPHVPDSAALPSPGPGAPAASERAPPRHGGQVRGRGPSATHRHLRRLLRPCWGRARRAPRLPRLREAPGSAPPAALFLLRRRAPWPRPSPPGAASPRRRPPARPSRPPLSCDPWRGGGEAGPGRIRAAAVARSAVLAVLPPPLGGRPCPGCGEPSGRRLLLGFPARPGGARRPARVRQGAGGARAAGS